MKLWVKHLPPKSSKPDKRKRKPTARFVPQLELLERREAPNSLYNPLFASAFESLDPLDVPYSIVPGDGSNSGSSNSGNGGSSGGTGPLQGGSSGGTGGSQPPPDNFTPADPAAAASTIGQNASLFDSVLGNDAASFGSVVAAAVGAQGPSGPQSGTPGVGAAVVTGVPGPWAGGGTASGGGGSQGGGSTTPTPGPAPAISPAPGAAPTAGVGLSPSQFGLDPFPLVSGATVSALTPFAVSPGMAVPAAASNGTTAVTSGTDAGGIGYTTTTIDSYAFNASLAQDATGGWTYMETYSFKYDAQTVPAGPGGASVHDWGASGYTFIANNDNGKFGFTLTAALTACETGSQTQTNTAADGSTSTATTTWQSESQYERTITNSTDPATGAATGTDSGLGVLTQSTSSAGTYSRPLTISFGVGTVTGSQSAYSGQGQSYQFSLNESRASTGAITQSGTWADASGGYSGDWYSGSGSYAVASASGGPSGSGSTTTPATADATPVPSASGGPFVSGATVTGGGVYNESGADSMGYGSSDQYTLQNDGSWQASSGMGSSSGTGWTQEMYSGSGGYTYPIDGGSVGGAWQQSAGTETNYSNSTNSTLGSASWAQTGTASSGDAGWQYNSYQGAGNYVIDSTAAPAGGSAGSSTSGSASGDGSDSGSGGSSAGPPPAVSPSPVPSASGGPYAPGVTFAGAGTVSETEFDSSNYADKSQYTLAPDGSWQPASGSGSARASSSTLEAYSASGGYGYAIAGGSVSGTWQQSGSGNTWYNSTTNSTLGSDGSWTSTGSSASGDAGWANASYTGSGSYLIDSPGAGSVTDPGISTTAVPSASGGPAAPGAAFSGTGVVTESGSDSSGYADTSRSTQASDGSWQQTAGESWASGSGSAQWAYSASGPYSYPIAGGSVNGTWQQSGSGNTDYNTTTDSTRGSGGAWTTTGNTTTGESGTQHIFYSGSGEYAIASSVGVASLSGNGSVSEWGKDDWSYGYTTQATVGSSGLWQTPTGSGGTTEISSDFWSYSALGAYTRPFDGGTVFSGTWQASGSACGSSSADTTSTLNPDGTWTTTGTASSSGSGSGLWAYSGSGSFAQATSTGDSANGSQSSLSSQATESVLQGWTTQYSVLSTLAATGLVTTVTVAAASGSASGVHTYSSSSTSDSWSQTGDYAAGNGSASDASASSGTSLTDGIQPQWQEGYVITAAPTGTTITGGAAGANQATGDATWYYNTSGSDESDSTGSGYASASGDSWSSDASGNDHYNDQSSWSAPYNPAGTSSSGPSSGAPINHVWGSTTASWSSGSWWWSQNTSSGSSSGTGGSSGSSSSLSTSGSGADSYDLLVGYAGFFQGGNGYSGRPVTDPDVGWTWGVGWSGGGRTGPLGPSAYSGLGYVFAPGNPVSLAPIDDQAVAEGQAVSLQVLATDWSAVGGAGSSGGGTYSADGLPPGLTINAQTGLISGTVAAGAYLAGPSYDTLVTYTDAGGYSASQVFAWFVSDPVTVTNPGDQSSLEGQAATLSPAVTDGNPANTGFTWSAQNLPTGLVIDPTTGVISGVLAAGSANVYPVQLTATDAGGTSDSQLFYWTVTDPVTLTDPGSQSATEGAAVSLPVAGTDANGLPLAWTATGLPPGLGIDPGTGLITGTPGAGEAATGAFTATVTATDPNGSSASQTFDWNVAPAVTFADPGPQASTEGQAVALAVPATDSTGGTLSYSATGLPPGLGIDPGTGVISGAAATGAAAGGPYTVTVTASDGPYSGGISFTWNVAGGTVSITDPEQQSSTEGAAVALQIQASDASGAALLYTATGLPPGLTLNPTTGLISGAIPAGAAASGPYTVTVTAWGADGSSASQTFNWNVAPAVTFADPGEQSSTEGAAVSLAVPAADAKAGTLTYSATGLPPGLGIDPNTGAITGTVAAGAAGGPYTVTVTATDGSYSGSQPFVWDVAPALTLADPGPQANLEGNQVDVPVDVTDAAGGTPTFSATGLPSGLTIDPATGAITGTIQAGAAAAQPYTAVVTATDGAYSASQTISWQVNPASPSSPSYGDMAAEDANLASAAWPRPGGFADPVAQPGQDGPAFSDFVYRPGQDDPREVLVVYDEQLGVPHPKPEPQPPQWDASAVRQEAARLDPEAEDWAVGRNVTLTKTYWSNSDTYKLGPGGDLYVTISASHSPVEAVQVYLQQVHAAMKEVAQAPAKQLAQTLATRPSLVIDNLVKDNLAMRRGDFVYIPTVAGDSVLLLLYVCRRETQGVPFAWSPFRVTTGNRYYELVKTWKLPLQPGQSVADNLAKWMTDEQFTTRIASFQSQQAADAAQAAADMTGMVYDSLPFGSFWDNLIVQHNYREATISLLADLALFAAGPLAEAAGEGTLVARGIRLSAITVEAGIGAARATQAYFAFQGGNNAQGYAYLGEALLRASVQAVAEFKVLASAGPTLEGGGKAAEDAQGALKKLAQANKKLVAAEETLAELKAVNRATAEAEQAVADAGTAAERALLECQSTTSCFAAGTPLLTPTGAKLIEDVRPGDLLLSRAESDPDGPLTAKAVEAVFVRLGRILHLHVGGQVIRTTGEHPFWVPGRGWVPAGGLRLGDPVLSHDGQVQPVEDVLDTGEYETVYNVRVADFHTYFVGRLAWGFSVWAHNAFCDLTKVLQALGLGERKLSDNELGSILSYALQVVPDIGEPLTEETVKEAVIRLRASLARKGITLTREQEAKVFSAAFKDTKLKVKNFSKYLVKPTPVPALRMTKAEFDALENYGTKENPCRILQDKKGRNVLIYGKLSGSSTTDGHWDAMADQAARLAESGEYSEIYFQKSWKTATGEAGASGLEPDIIAIRHDGKVDAWEVWSKTDITRGIDLRGRLRDGMRSLPPKMRGFFDVLDPLPPTPPPPNR